MEQLSARDQKIVLDRDSGLTYEALAERHGLSTQRVYTIVHKEIEHLNRLELELMVAKKTGQAVGLMIPYQDQSDRQLALDYFEWVRSSLTRRGVDVEVERRGTTEGEVFFLLDVTDEGGGG